jgi:hypothetical protein
MSFNPKVTETMTHSQRCALTGKTFTSFRSTSALGASSWIDLQFNPTSTSTIFHLENVLVNHSAGICKFEVIETSSTITTGSSSRDALNVNRNSTKTANFELYGDPTNISSTFVKIRTIELGSTGSPLSSGHTLFCHQDGLFLSVDSTTIIRITDLSASAGYSFFEITICEG